MAKLEIWHGVKHDDFTVTTVTCQTSAEQTLSEFKRDGGLWIDDGETKCFIPFHRINYVEVK